MKASSEDGADSDEQALLQRAANWPKHPSIGDLTADTLRLITDQEGIDFATALLFDRFCKAPERAAFIRDINARCRNLSSTCPKSEAKVVIVPGALYVERPKIGTDGRLIREIAAQFGLASDLIPLASFGSARHNAETIRDWLKQHSEERVILVSLSKGGADLKIALSGPDAPDTFRNVIAWVNVCGPLTGSRIANWVMSTRMRTWLIRCKFRLQKRDFQFITDLQQGKGTPLDLPLTLPTTLKMLSLVGFPLKRHMNSTFSRFCHRILAAWGPNEGTISLCDLREWPGEIYPVWGVDHYFRPEASAKRLIAAVLQYVAERYASAQDPDLSCSSQTFSPAVV